jgi:hypothetical protein
MPRSLEEVVALQGPRAAARAMLDQAAFEAAARRGAQMSLQEIVAFVTDMLRVADRASGTRPGA